MEFFKETHINFLSLRKWTTIFSTLLFLASISALLMNGLNWGLDFTGGTQIEIAYQQPAKLTQIRQELNKAGFEQAVVQSYGTAEDILISVAPQKNVKQDVLVNRVMNALPGATKQRVDYVGPQVGKELTSMAIFAVLVSFLATMIYIALRFEYRFALSSTAALIHDPVLIIGIFAYFHLQFDLKALAALLTVIGYSLNDTIVVFDRVRENFRKLRKANPVEIMNLSINQTLSRTIMTSGLTLVVVIALFLYGGEAIHGFALALMIGIIIGTYSSIYVAGTLAVVLGLSKKDLMPTPKTELDERP